jgi:hypothetical protein
LYLVFTGDGARVEKTYTSFLERFRVFTVSESRGSFGEIVQTGNREVFFVVSLTDYFVLGLYDFFYLSISSKEAESRKKRTARTEGST